MGRKANVVRSMTKAITQRAIAKGKKEVELKAKTLEKLIVTYVPIESIHPNLYNPNRQSEHEFTMLLDSMRTNGFTQPIIVQKKNNEIVDGEHRWRAAMKLGMKEIPVVFVEMSKEQMRIATLSHNRARGSENVELTAQLLRDLEKMGALNWAQNQLGLDDVEIQRLITDIPAPESLAADSFSNAWTPRTSGTDSTADIVSMTLEASGRMRELEDRIKTARTEEDRTTAKKELRVYKLNLIYTNLEADIVKKVLGDRPAQRVLELCQSELDK